MPLSFVAFLTFILPLVIGLNCASPDALPTGQRPVEINVTGVEKALHARINHERTQRNIDALGWNNALARIAQQHSQHMAEADFFSHQSPDGLSPTERARNAGFECIIELEGGQRIGVGENIFTSYTYHSYTSSVVNGEEIIEFNWKTEEELADEIVRNWMKSTGHRKNMLRPDYAEEGIGIFITAQNQLLVTQKLC